MRGLSVLCVVLVSGLLTVSALAQDRPSAAPPPDRPEVAPPQKPDALRRPGEARRDLRVADDIMVVRDVVYGEAEDDDGQPVELRLDAAFLKQSNGEPMPVVVYIHGGGWRGGSKEGGLPFTIAFARGGYFAVTINYRLAGKAKYPAAVHDCKAAIRFLRANAGELGIDPNRIGVWGHSAGGHLSNLLGTSGNSDALEGKVGETGVSSEVQCVVSVSGPTDLLHKNVGQEGRGMIRSWLGGDSEEEAKKRAREASPTTYIDADDPPFLLVHGTEDSLVPFDQAELFSKALTEAGVANELYAVQGAGHGIGDPEAYLRVAAFFDRHLGGDVVSIAKKGQLRRGRGGSGDRRGRDRRGERGAGGGPA